MLAFADLKARAGQGIMIVFADLRTRTGQASCSHLQI